MISFDIKPEVSHKSQISTVPCCCYTDLVTACEQFEPRTVRVLSVSLFVSLCLSLSLSLMPAPSQSSFAIQSVLTCVSAAHVTDSVSGTVTVLR